MCIRDRAWENNWLPFSILSFAVFPWLIAWHTTPDIAAAYLHAHVIDILAAVSYTHLDVYKRQFLSG